MREGDGKENYLPCNALTSIHRGNRLDGRRSDEQVDFGGNKIKCLISLTDAG